MNVHCDQILAGKDDSFITRHDSFVSITGKVYALIGCQDRLIEL